MALNTVDPITLSRVWHAMQTIARESRHLIDRTAQNYLIGQLHDVSVGIWNAKGETVAMPLGLPVQFLGSAQRGARNAVMESQMAVARASLELANQGVSALRKEDAS